jgi:hypothetical protein
MSKHDLSRKELPMLTGMIYYLGVKTIQNAADALDKLTFIEVLNRSTLQIYNKHYDRTTVTVGPASKDDDLSKGLMIVIGGSFTSDEMTEIKNLSKLADKSVTTMVAEYIARQAVALQSQGKGTTHMILGQ